jgi:hypothetical protein
LLRFLADSNCCSRFCRPVPNRSAKKPLLNGTQRYSHFIHLCNSYAKVFPKKYFLRRKDGFIQRYIYLWPYLLETRCLFLSRSFIKSLRMQTRDYIVFILYFIVVSVYGYWIYNRKKAKETSANDFFWVEGSLTGID